MNILIQNKELIGYCGGDQAFAQWLDRVDRYLNGVCGLGVLDLADQNYRYSFEDGLSAIEVAESVLESEGYPHA